MDIPTLVQSDVTCISGPLKTKKRGHEDEARGESRKVTGALRLTSQGWDTY